MNGGWWDTDVVAAVAAVMRMLLKMRHCSG